MRPDHIFWIALAAYAFHILEEYIYDWKTWAQKILKLQIDWSTFYVMNAVMFIFGLACAEVGWAHPTFGLMFPALIVVDALVFHIVPYVRSKRKFSPGLITAILLLLPIGIKSFTTAIDMTVYTKSLLIAGFCGILVVVFVVFLLKTKSQEFFKP